MDENRKGRTDVHGPRQKSLFIILLITTLWISKTDFSFRDRKNYSKIDAEQGTSSGISHWEQKNISQKHRQNLSTTYREEVNTNSGSFLKNSDIEQHSHFLQTSLKAVWPVRSDKYIIYHCSNTRRNCGGWSDRLSGIITTFIISLITSRHFMIHHDYPCGLERFLVPHKLDWRFNRSLIVGKKEKYYYYDGNEGIRESLRHSDLNKMFPYDVTYIRVNWDYTTDFRLRKDIERVLPWITKYALADTQRAIIEFLFKPSEELLHTLNKIKEKHKRDKMICAHFRIGKNPSLPYDRPRTTEEALFEIWAFLKSYDQKNYSIFIASDSISIKRKARAMFRNYIDFQQKISHIDLVKTKNDCEGLKGVLVDFYYLQSYICDTLVVGQSGFSIKAAHMRHSSENMHCFRKNNILPCSRYTLVDIYPLFFRPFIDLELEEYELLLTDENSQTPVS